MRPNHADLLPLMPGFLTELGISTLLATEDAACLLARLVAEGISERRVTPYEGARFIWLEIVSEVWPNQQHPLLFFAGYASEYEDCESYSQNPEETRREIEQEIIQKARAFLRAQ